MSSRSGLTRWKIAAIEYCRGNWDAAKSEASNATIGIERCVIERINSPEAAHCKCQSRCEAFPYASAPKFLILDHDAKYGLQVPVAVRAMNITPIRTSTQSPWQNGVAEQWVGSCRRELLDHVIAINEWHLKRLVSE